MANRMYFVSQPATNRIFEERNCYFDYHRGFALSQKQKCIESLHESINNDNPLLRVLEISTKSMQPLGVVNIPFKYSISSGGWVPPNPD